MTNLEERLALLRAEHAKCKQAAAAHEAQALRIEGAIALVGEMLAEQAKEAKPLTEPQRAPLTEQDSKQFRAVATNPPMTRIPLPDDGDRPSLQGYSDWNDRVNDKPS